MTYKEALLSIVDYPVPDSAVQVIAESRDLDMNVEITGDTINSDSFKLAKADLYVWVSFAPNISQGGVSFDLLVTDRVKLRDMANVIYKDLDDPNYDSGIRNDNGIRNVFTFTADDI